ncbi:MAG: XylR N-terminal domain-containing protein [Blastocatellia bacterium]
MNSSRLKLLELLKVDEAAGTIHFKHRRMLIFDADAMGLLRKELIETLGLERARRILTRFGYACGYRDALTSKELFHWQSDADWFAAGPRLHTLEGIVRARLLRLQMDKSGGVLEAEAEWLHSYEAEQHLRHIGHSDSPVCWTLTGYASGYTSAVFGSEVCCFETECVGQGDARCLVEGRATTEQSEEMRAHLEYHRPFNLDGEFQQLLDELERREKELAAHEEKVQALESHVHYLQLSKTVSLAADSFFFWRQRATDGLYSQPGFLLRTGQATPARYVGALQNLEILWRVDHHTTIQFLAAYYEVGRYLREAQPPGRNTTYFSAKLNYKF